MNAPSCKSRFDLHHVELFPAALVALVNKVNLERLETKAASGAIPGAVRSRGSWLLPVGPMTRLRIERRELAGHTTGVYFIKCGAFVKIGASSDVLRRLYQMTTDNPFEVVPSAFIRCDTLEVAFKVEKVLHRRCAASRGRGEWFHLSSQVQEEIAGAQPWPRMRW